MLFNDLKNCNFFQNKSYVKGWSYMLLPLFFMVSCISTTKDQVAVKPIIIQLPNQALLDNAIDDWHLAATNADSASYFDFFTDQGRFLGTDANENWSKKQFLDFSTPYFQKGKAWSFTALDRNIYYSSDSSTAWFDERLDTWMGECRGSGVLVMENESIKLAHYNLAVTIANEKIQDFIKLTTPDN